MTPLINRLRAARFRQAAVADAELLLPPPLPLIKLPEESPPARTGAVDGRPEHLPVRRHLHPEHRNHAPEPTLVESRIELDAEADAESDVTERVHVYEYNRPEISQDCGAADDTLVFDSLFEGGNLQRADRVSRASGSTHEYELLIHPDLKNSAYRQWFYFEVRNGRRDFVYKFSLVNLAKSGALFGHGLQPCVYSEIDASSKQRGWFHAGTHVRYDVSTSPNAPPGTNALSFQFKFEHDNDCVYFACLQPYTYSDLVEYLDRLERDAQRSVFVRRTELCQTIAQNTCDLLSITAPNSKDGLPVDDKKLIVISARVHPGEPNASWMMKGMLDYLTGGSSGAAVLRNHFVFKVVPMLNPDGVINGNTRVNLAGWDLNRKWSSPVEKLFPTVYHLKKQLANWQSRDRVAIYCDLHGHSINRNIFTYGCFNKRGNKKQNAAMNAAVNAATAAASVADGSLSLQSGAQPSVKNDPRVFPMIVAKNSEFFSFASCDFKVQKSKLNTARVVVNRELGVINSYTLEASFCGPDFGSRRDTQFSTWDLEDMGRSWCQSLLVYFGLLPQVRSLDQRREEGRIQQEAASHEHVSSSECTNPHEELAIVTPDAALLELNANLLSDCEAALSELFASVDLFEETAARDDSCDSDISGAEDAIPPEGVVPPEDGALRMPRPLANGYASAPEEYSHGGVKSVPKKLKRRASSRRKKSSSGGFANRTPTKKKSKSKRRVEQRDDLENPSDEDEAELNGCERGKDGAADISPRVSKRKKSKRSRRRRKAKSKSQRRADTTSEVATHSSAIDQCINMASGRLADVVLPEVPGSSGGSRRQITSPADVADGTSNMRMELPGGGGLSGPRRRSKPNRVASARPLELPPVVPRCQQQDLLGVAVGATSKLKPSKRQSDPPDDDATDSDHSISNDSDSGSASSELNSVASEF